MRVAESSREYTTGIISKIHDTHFQTDAAVGSGNSGGPLLDWKGDVLGVTTFMLDPSQGTNFAVRMRMRARNCRSAELGCTRFPHRRGGYNQGTPLNRWVRG